MTAEMTARGSDEHGGNSSQTRFALDAKKDFINFYHFVSNLLNDHPSEACICSFHLGDEPIPH